MNHRLIINIVLISGLYLALWGWFRKLPWILAHSFTQNGQTTFKVMNLWGICSAYIAIYLILWRAGILLH